MITHLHTVCWNEADMLGFFFRHYDSFVDRYFIYDDGSTDGSLQVLRRNPKVVVRKFDRTHQDSFVLSHRQMQNEVWKESRGQADWVIVTALDEHLHILGPPIADYLRACMRRGITLIPALGYQMITHDTPDSSEWLCGSRTWGAPCSLMNKLSVFNPNAIEETGFHVGRHAAEPQGRLRFPLRDELMILHYKYLNFERTLQRHQAQSKGLREYDVAQGWGVQYHWSAIRLREEWAKFEATALDMKRPFQPWQAYQPPRWWRPEDFKDVQLNLLHRLGLKRAWTTSPVFGSK